MSSSKLPKRGKNRTRSFPTRTTTNYSEFLSKETTLQKLLLIAAEQEANSSSSSNIVAVLVVPPRASPFLLLEDVDGVKFPRGIAVEREKDLLTYFTFRRRKNVRLSAEKRHDGRWILQVFTLI